MYRKKILTGEVKDFLDDQLETIAATKGYKILEKRVMPDHIHLFIESNPFDSPVNIVKIFKSITGLRMFKKFPELQKQLWPGVSTYIKYPFLKYLQRSTIIIHRMMPVLCFELYFKACFKPLKYVVMFHMLCVIFFVIINKRKGTTIAIFSIIVNDKYVNDMMDPPHHPLIVVGPFHAPNFNEAEK